MKTTQRATVWTRDCGKVRMMLQPSDDCEMYWDLPTGSRVVVIERGEEWSKVATGKHEGYIKTRQLLLGSVMFNTDNGTIVIDRTHLKDIYDALGGMVMTGD